MARAQEAQSFSLTVTPPLFQLSLSPGEVWSSGLTVVNTNPYDITVYARVAHFEAEGEEGQGRFRELTEEEAPFSLAGWITLSEGPVTVPKGKTKTIPLVIEVPEEAAPGGHYAAILVSNRADKSAVRGSALSVTSSVASLVFLRVSGDVVEKGVIREFSVARLLYQEPEIDFTLRFQNVGNVHLQPQGSVTIYNMWGKERGTIPINQKTDFGNVLPGTTRKFTFTWKGPEDGFDFGRFRAIATLAYGERARENISRETTFWIIPVTAVVKALAAIMVLLGAFVYLLKRYIRRALRLEAEALRRAGVEGGTSAGVGREEASPSGTSGAPPPLRLTTLMRPLKEGATDLRRVSVLSTAIAPRSSTPLRHTPTEGGDRMPFGQFVRKYALFFLFLAVVAAAAAAAVAFFRSALVYERPYEVIIKKPDGAAIPLSR